MTTVVRGLKLSQKALLSTPRENARCLLFYSMVSEWTTDVSIVYRVLYDQSNSHGLTVGVRMVASSSSSLYLSDTCFADRVFYCNSGTEANEGAIKFARKFQKVRAEAAGETEWAGGGRLCIHAPKVTRLDNSVHRFEERLSPPHSHSVLARSAFTRSTVSKSASRHPIADRIYRKHAS